MSKTIGPNSPCPCGSGKKYKKCHGATAVKGKIPVLYWIAGAAAVAVLAFWFGRSQTRSDVPSTPSSFAPGEAPPGKVWSVEHGHWHDAP